MAGSESVAAWIAGKLKGDRAFLKVETTGSGFLSLERKDGATFEAVAIGVDDVVKRAHVEPLFADDERCPEFVVNVPSKAIWEGGAIAVVHDAPAAFGTLGDLIRASRDEPVYAYRNKQDEFFERAFRQHSAVRRVTRLYDRLYHLERRSDRPDMTVVLVDAYDMSAEDIRHARDLYGKFDAALKMTSYGSVTTAAREAAESMGAEAFKFGELMGRLNKSRR